MNHRSHSPVQTEQTEARSPAKEARSGAGASDFEALSQSYNYLTIESFAQTFADLIVSEAERRAGQSRILDIGCGSGIGREVRHQWRIKKVAREYWGIEPDEEIESSDGLFDEFQHALMETAALPSNSFDIAYSAMVMEHVAEPDAFLSSLHRALKPGGVYLFITPNANSFVPWATKVLHTLCVDELAVRLVRGQSKVDEYHYPVRFRCNTPKQLNRLAEANGFAPPEFAYIEGLGSQSYLRGPLAPLRGLISWKRNYLRRPENLATLICRMTKQ